MKTFSEEQLAVELVLCDGVLEHCLRIDRVLRQPLGHVLLVRNRCCCRRCCCGCHLPLPGG